MSTASSASDRIEQARAAIAAYREAHDVDLVIDNLVNALESMISPAAIDETPEQVADEWYAGLQQRGLVETYGLGKVTDPTPFGLHRAAYLAGIRTGIVMSWNSWEPETAPGVPSGTVEQLIANGKAALDKVEWSTEQDTLDPVLEARDEAAGVIQQFIEALEGER